VAAAELGAGWDSEHTPVADVRWALEEIQTALPAAVPVGLVGHSLGGRAAILGAGDRGVRSVVALNPWTYPDDGNVDATGRRALLVHGTADRIASLARAAGAAQRLARTAQVGLIRVEGGTHAMLRHHGIFDALAADFAAATLLGRPAPDSDGALAQILAGATTATA
jgi:pimeloyl-ACP methyl ester carboxylesterase